MYAARVTVGRFARVLCLLVLVLVASACRARDHEPPEAGAATSIAALPAAPLPAAPLPAAPPTAVTASALPVADWNWTPCRGDHFTVLFPREPKVEVLPAEDDKAGFREISLEVPGGQVSFAVGVTEHAAEEVRKPEFLDERASTPRRGFAVVLHKRATSLPGGQPGRVLIERGNISGTPLRGILASLPRGPPALPAHRLNAGGGRRFVKRFMDSFKLT